MSINNETNLSPSMICIHGACIADAKATMIIDKNGEDSVALAKFDKNKPTLIIVETIEMARKVSLHYSTIPIMVRSLDNPQKPLELALTIAKDKGVLSIGDKVAYVEGIQKPCQKYTEQAALRIIEIT